MKTSFRNASSLLALTALASLFPISNIMAQTARSDDEALVADSDGVKIPPKPVAKPENAASADAGTAQSVELNPKMIQAKPVKEGEKIPKTDLTIPEIVAGSEDFTTLMGAIKAAGLQATLGGDGPFTVLAPNNAAFAALPEGVLSMLLKPDNRTVLKKILSYHVLPVKMMAADFVPGDLATVEGESITVVGQPKGVVTFQGAKLGITDVNAKNGVIQVIDHVLIPPSVDIEGLAKPGTKKAK